MTDDDDPHPGARVLPFARPARRDAPPAAPAAPIRPPDDDDDEAGDAWLLADLEAQGLDATIEAAERAVLRGDPAAHDDLPALRNARALRSLLRGDRDAAFAEWQALIDEDPRLCNALALRRIYRQRAGDFEGALADLAALIGLWPKDAEHYTARGLLFIQLKDHARARADFERAAHLAPRNHASYVWLGRSQSLAGDHAAALRAFGRAIKLAPWRADLYEERATEFSLDGSPEAAMADLTRCLELDPKCAVAYRKRAVLHPWPEGADARLADLDAALALEPDDRHALRVRAACHSLRGDTWREEADLTRAIDLFFGEPAGAYDVDVDVDLHAARAEAHMQVGLYGQAVDDLTRVIRLQYGRDAAMFVLRAEARRKDRNLHAAACDYMAASRIDGVTWQALRRSMEENRDEGRREAYLEDLEILLLMNPRDQDALAERARMHEAAERYDRARADLDDALDGADYRHDLLLQRARVRGALGDFAGAVDDLSRALAVTPAEAHYLGYRGAYRALADGPSAEAEADVDRAVAYAPDDPTAHYLRAWYLELAERPEEAAREHALSDECQAELARRAEEA